MNNLMRIVVVLCCLTWATPLVAEEITLFAAASTTNAVTELAERYSALHHVRVKTSFASSSTLAKQIKNGAPADVYISANTQWMDYLESGGAIAPGSRQNLLANRLVLIAPAGSRSSVVIDETLDMTALLRGGYLAMGDASHVPAGIYARKALENLGLWRSVQGHVSNSKDVRAVLMLVERGETSLGIVYATDAKISDNVTVVGEFPVASYPPVIYPVAIIRGGERPAVKAFMAFLSGDAAGDIFRKYGFERT